MKLFCRTCPIFFTDTDLDCTVILQKMGGCLLVLYMQINTPVYQTFACLFFSGVSCDSCLKGNFRGKRYKCLVCYDYDLCATCYEAGATTTRHTADHSMQCILTRNDFGKSATTPMFSTYSNENIWIMDSLKMHMFMNLTLDPKHFI